MSSRLLLLGGAAAAAAAAVALRQAYLRRSPVTPALTVMTWNVLAAPYTKYNGGPPHSKCVQGHRNPAGKVETQAQTRERYSLASQDILAQAPDVVLLQELEADFLDPTKDANPGASSLQAAYAVHATHDAGPGTAVLLRKERQLGVLEVRRVGATAETGGVSKSATAVRVAVAGASSAAAGRSCWFVSIHLAPPKFNAEAVRRHLGLLHGILQAAGAPAASATAPPRVVVAGDLNADPAELTELQRTSCLGGLTRVVHPALGNTGLSGDFAHPVCIDHMLVSPGVRVDAAARAGEPCSPYSLLADGEAGPARVVSPSDHVWQTMTLQFD